MSSERRLIEGTGIPLPGNDIDTDRIIPARYLKSITFEGLGENVFKDERFDANGAPKPHPLNDPRYRGGSVLLVNQNFGCGSSREHAPQSLLRYGIHAIVGESFAEIFAGNATVIGMPCVRASGADVGQLMNCVQEHPDVVLRVDLEHKQIKAGDLVVVVEMPEAARSGLMHGTWDTTAMLLEHRDAIAAVAGRLPYIRTD